MILQVDDKFFKHKMFEGVMIISCSRSQICPCFFFFSTRHNVCCGAPKDDIWGCFPVSSRVCRFDPFLNSKQVELIPEYENNNNMHDTICVIGNIYTVIYLYAWCKNLLRCRFREICVKQHLCNKSYNKLIIVGTLQMCILLYYPGSQPTTLRHSSPQFWMIQIPC